MPSYASSGQPNFRKRNSSGRCGMPEPKIPTCSPPKFLHEGSPISLRSRAGGLALFTWLTHRSRHNEIRF